MASYMLRELEVIGFNDEADGTEVPLVYQPIYAVRDQEVVLFPPYVEVENDDPVTCEDARQITSRGELRRFVDERGGVTFFKQPCPAMPNHCIYVAPGGKADYRTLRDAAENMRIFAREKREAGDREFREGRRDRACTFYSLAVSASQTAEDFARVLLCEANEKLRATCTRAIVALGENPEEVMLRVSGQLGVEI